ncbi:MAG TPA: hypothetical protein VM915_13105 [Verrucomicrobiae bacterium]|nr:hypothetical protein [Verrucomicrobiae bacterium]
MSEWPEPVREPGETPRWLGWTIAALVFGALFWTVRDDNGLSFDNWRMPELAMPQMDVPEIQWPDFAENEAAAPSQGHPQPAPADMADGSAIAEASPVVPGVTFDFVASAVPGMPFEACLEIANQAAGGLGALSVVESSDDRRVMRFKTLEGGLTIGCSRADGMQVERR